MKYLFFCVFSSIDLSSNSMVVLTAWGPNDKPFGGTSMKLFDEKDSSLACVHGAFKSMK